MLSAQRWLFAPPFAVSFPGKEKKRKYVLTFNALFDHNSRTIMVENVTKTRSWHSL